MPIEQYGFRYVGRWCLYDRNRSGIDFELQAFRQKRVVYAFLIGRSVMYLGICENRKTTLTSRLSRYKHMQGSGQNERVAGKIRTALIKKPVDIFALLPSKVIMFRRLQVDLVKGLEYPLIEKLKPHWNKSGTDNRGRRQ